MSTHIEAMEAAVRALKAQFSIVHGNQSDNEDVVREFSVEMMKALAGLVFDAGGDPDYVEPWVEGIANDVDLAFQSAREPVVTPMFKARRGLGLTLVEGARL
jgi:hypothetical protein